MLRMLRRLTPHAANALTGLRVVLTPMFVAAVLWAERSRFWGIVGVLIFAVVAASDVWDGRVARRWRSSSDAGRSFDHFADIGFLLAALGTYVAVGLVPWWVPGAVAMAFGFYVVDSRLRASVGPTLIGSRIGHVGGVCNYVLVGVLVCNNSAGIRLLPPALLYGLFYLVPLYSAAAMGARLAALRVSGSPGLRV